MPAVIAPSPMTATVLFVLSKAAMPSAAPIDVLECPTPKASYSLSWMAGNGASPPFFLMVSI